MNQREIAKIGVRLLETEDKIFLTEQVPKKIGESVADELSKVSLKLTQVIWSKPITIELSTERSSPQLYESYPQGGDCIVFLPGSTGIVTVYLDSSLAFGYTMPPFTKVRAPFTELYIQNTAQSGKKAYLLIGKGDFDVKAVASEPYVYNIDMPSANTEYSQRVPDGTVKFTMWCTDGTPFRFAWEPGHVAAPTPPYGQIIASASYWEDGVYLINKTLYFACAEAGKTVVLQCYTSTYTPSSS